jgi:hypothetical protein
MSWCAYAPAIDVCTRALQRVLVFYRTAFEPPAPYFQ